MGPGRLALSENTLIEAPAGRGLSRLPPPAGRGGHVTTRSQHYDSYLLTRYPGDSRHECAWEDGAVVGYYRIKVGNCFTESL